MDITLITGYVYVVLVQSKQFQRATKVSTVVYRTLEAAQEFCLERGDDVKKLTDWCYEDTEYYYTIYPTHF